VTKISSVDPIERVLAPGDTKEGYFEVKEDVKCLMNVRAARMFPFWRFLKILGVEIFGGPEEDENGTYGSTP
jgi:hypothetical protein